MVNRINVYAYTVDEYGDGGKTLDGWFDRDKATAYHEATDWDGNNNISRATGSQWEHETLYRTAQGRWVLRWWSQWDGCGESYKYIDADAARTWLLIHEEDAAAEEHFGKIAEEAGPSPIGNAVHVRLGNLLPQLDQWAADQGLGRAEAIRKILADRLTSVDAQP